MNALLTGFEPFGQWSVNPSGEVVQALREATLPCALQTRLLPVDFAAAGPLLRKTMDEVRPALVLLLGQGGGAALRVERVGINLNDIPGRQDNRGCSPEEEPIDPVGPAAYFASIPVRGLVRQLTQAGVPAVESFSAGAFLCNHVLYAARQHAETMAALGTAPRVGFIHLPLLPEQAAAAPSREKPPSMDLALQIKGIRAALEWLIDQVG